MKFKFWKKETPVESKQEKKCKCESCANFVPECNHDWVAIKPLASKKKVEAFGERQRVVLYAPFTHRPFKDEVCIKCGRVERHLTKAIMQEEKKEMESKYRAKVAERIARNTEYGD